MSVNPDYRNQYTTLDAERAENTVHAHCERCGCGISRVGKRNTKRFCSPCSDIWGEEKRREYSRQAYLKRKALKP